MVSGRAPHRLTATAASALLALAAWWWFDEPSPRAGAAAGATGVTPLVATATHAETQGHQGHQVQGLATQAKAMGPGPALPEHGASASAGDTAAQALHTEVCGISSQVPLSAAEPHASLIDRLPPHLGAQPIESARQHFLQALEGGDARARAAAALFHDDGAAKLAAAGHGSRDAAVLSWALQRCPESGCDADLAERWVQLEPDNLAAWLSLADTLPQRRTQALEQAAQARRFELHRPALLATLQRALPASVPPHVRHALMQEVLIAEAALATPALHTIEIECARAASTAPGLSPQRCANFAAVLRGSDTLHAGWAGLRMARAQGLLPAPEFKAAREVMVTIAAQPGRLAQMPQPLGCEAIERFSEWLQQRVTGGEAAAARWLDQKRRAQPGPTAGTRP